MIPPKNREELIEKIAQMKVKAKVDTENKQRKRRKQVLKKAGADKSTKRKDLPDTILIIDDIDEPVSVPSPYHRKRNLGIIVTDSSMNALATTGMQIDDQVVDAYMSLLVNECFQSQKKENLAAVSCGVLPLLKDRGFEGVKHLFTDKSVHLVPGFVGEWNSGHWAAIIIDRECAKKEGGAFVFVDSLASMRQSNYASAQEMFRTSRYANAKKILMDSPYQARGSNDCAVFMLGAFAHWAIRSNITCLPTTFQLQNSISAADYGSQMRRHVHEKHLFKGF